MLEIVSTCLSYVTLFWPTIFELCCTLLTVRYRPVWFRAGSITRRQSRIASSRRPTPPHTAKAFPPPTSPPSRCACHNPLVTWCGYVGRRHTISSHYSIVGRAWYAWRACYGVLTNAEEGRSHRHQAAEHRRDRLLLHGIEERPQECRQDGLEKGDPLTHSLTHSLLLGQSCLESQGIPDHCGCVATEKQAVLAVLQYDAGASTTTVVVIIRSGLQVLLSVLLILSYSCCIDDLFCDDIIP